MPYFLMYVCLLGILLGFFIASMFEWAPRHATEIVRFRKNVYGPTNLPGEFSA